MRILKLKLENFRNIKETEIIPCDGMNVICGENAQGKTNIIESIWLFTGAKSFRGCKDYEFVKFNEKKAECKLDFIAEGIEKNAVLEIEERRKAVLNENKLKSVSLLVGKFNAIIFSPDDLRLVCDGPAVRRRFLDIAIGQIYPSYVEILRNYLRAVTQRNKIIKDIKYDSSVEEMLDIFEDEIATNGIKIIKYRNRYIEILNEFLPNIYNGISNGRETLTVDYIKSFNGSDLKESLKIARKEDIYTATTSVGPHRDDIDFKINGISCRNYGSQGQKRSVAISLKLAQAEVIKKDVGEYPVCLLDDVMSELDPNRQNFILNRIKEMQTFLTCCDPENVKNLKAGKIFKVSGGEIF